MGFSGSGYAAARGNRGAGEADASPCRKSNAKFEGKEAEENEESIETSVAFKASRYRRNRPVKWLMFSSFRADAFFNA